MGTYMLKIEAEIKFVCDSSDAHWYGVYLLRPPNPPHKLFGIHIDDLWEWLGEEACKKIRGTPPGKRLATWLALEIYQC